MEKREVKVKCSGCGTPIKLKVPVSDAPVSFKCPKCQKPLKVRLGPPAAPAAPSPPPPPPPPPPPADSLSFGDEPSFDFEESPPPDSEQGRDAAPAPTPAAPDSSADEPSFELEQTQFPDGEGYHDTPDPVGAPQPHWEIERADAGSSEQVAPAAAPVSLEKPSGAIWMFMDEDIIRGPFTDAQILEFIRKGEIGHSTPMRLGERPWVQASQVAAFKALFSSQSERTVAGSAQHDDDKSDGRRDAGATSIVEPLLEAAPYPLKEGAGQPLGIFAGIAVILSTALCFDFLIGLPLNVAGWILLYGYLWAFMKQGVAAPDAPPPEWNFGAAKELFIDGAQVFAILLVFGLVPTGLVLLGVIIGFLNGMGLIGYGAMALMIPLFAGCMFILPAALLHLAAGGGLGAALRPVELIGAVQSGGKGYASLGILSVAAGFVCLLGVIAAFFLTEIPDFGFVLAGLVLGAALTYAHFVWFRGIGRFSAHVPLKTAPQPAEA